MRHGLVSTIDDLDSLTAEERKEMLDELAAKFAASGFNVRWLVEGICLSKAYQRVSTATPRRFGAAAGAHALAGSGVRGARPVARTQEGGGFSPRYTQEGQTLMAQLEAARGRSPTEFKGGIPQALLLMNGSVVTAATTLEESMTLRAVVDAPFLKDTEKLDALYLAAYSRLPCATEKERMMKLIRAKPEADAQRQAYANIFWVLLNSPEFVLCP